VSERFIVTLFLIDLLIILGLSSYVETSIKFEKVDCDADIGTLQADLSQTFIPEFTYGNFTLKIEPLNEEGTGGGWLGYIWFLNQIKVFNVIANVFIGMWNLFAGFMDFIAHTLQWFINFIIGGTNAIVKFANILKIMLSYPECHGIPQVLTIIIFSPMVIISVLTIIRLLPLVGGG